MDPEYIIFISHLHKVTCSRFTKIVMKNMTLEMSSKDLKPGHIIIVYTLRPHKNPNSVLDDNNL